MIQNYFKVWSEDFCDNLIELSEKNGFGGAPVINPSDFSKVKSDEDKPKYSKPDRSFFNAEKSFILRGDKNFELLQDKCEDLVEEFLPGLDFYMDYYSVVKYETGGYFGTHEDSHWQPNGATRTHTVIIYLSDFEGGELRFPKLGVEIQPKKGDLVIFPATKDYLHSAGVVTRGTKYSLTLWPLTLKRRT